MINYYASKVCGGLKKSLVMRKGEETEILI
jgi:hypothetical protein